MTERSCKVKSRESSIQNVLMFKEKAFRLKKCVIYKPLIKLLILRFYLYIYNFILILF